MQARVSVLVPVWNNAIYLGAALESALTQTRKPYEVIVVDDGSEDDSAAVAQAYGVLCHREPHRGVAAARNVAWAHASGDFIAWLDSDDVWLPNKLEVQAAYMEAHPDVAFTFTHQRLRFEPGVERPYWVTDAMMGGDAPAFGTCSMMVRNDMRELLGEFDPERLVGEDLAWSTRAHAKGIKFVILPDTLLERRVHANNISTTEALKKRDVLGILRSRIQQGRGGA